MSNTVRDLVAGANLRFGDRGYHALKGLDEDVHLFRARLKSRRGPPRRRDKRLACCVVFISSSGSGARGGSFFLLTNLGATNVRCCARMRSLRGPPNSLLTGGDRKRRCAREQ